MKKTVCILLLLSAAPGFGQQIGISLGSAVFDPSAVINMENTSPPKNICGHVAVRLSDDVKLGVSAGFGFESSAFRLENPNPGEEYGKNTKLTGVPLECEIQVSKPLVILSSIRPFIGLGLGYYDYRSTGDIRSGAIGTKFENRIRGLAQFFCLGLDYRLGRSISAFFEMKKMGFSGIEASGDYYTLVPGGKFKQPLKAEPGLDDLSLTVGVLFNLHPGHETSIFENLR
jgi:hypothetical protein